MPARPTDARERRIVVAGSLVAAVALFVAFVALPVARRWQAREEAIDTARARVARLRGLAEAPATPMDMTLASDEVLRGRTLALAGSELQRVLQEQARTARLGISRLEVATDSTAAPERGITAALTAVTDIYGVADFLVRLHAGRPLLVTEEVVVTPNPVLRGGLLQLTVGVRAPWVLEP